MTTFDILEAIDSEIENLRRARTLLIDAADSKASMRVDRGLRSETKRNKNHMKPLQAKKPNRSISAEGRARIAAAQKARWAAKKKVETLPNKPAPVTAKKAVKTSAKRTLKAIPAKKKAVSETPKSSAPTASDTVTE